MINANKKIGCLSIQKQQYNLKTEFYFDITNNISLAEFFCIKVLSKEGLITILKNICSIVKNTNKYFLNASNLILDFKHVYINQKDLEIKLIYIESGARWGKRGKTVKAVAVPPL